MSQRIWTAVLFLAIAGCNSSDVGKPADDPGPEIVTFGIEPFTVEPHQDHIWCKTMKVPGDVTLDVNSFKINMAAGSHHFILYRSDADLADGFGDCTEMNSRTFVVASQTPGSFEFAYPEGLAVPLFAGEQLILETHYSNPDDVAITGEVSVAATLMKHADVTDYVQTVLAPHTSFSIPPHSTGFTSGQEVNEVPGFKVISVSSHTHSRATLVTIDRTTPAGTARLLETTDWHAPPIARFNPPLEGVTGNKLRLECTWNNETDNPITFGPTTADEMCIAVITFYPAYSYSP